jgi:putative endonuclease
VYYAYVIQSFAGNSLYKGHCNNLELRLRQHNAGKTKSIRNKGPFALIYFEEYENENDAIAREKYFKTAAGRRFLKFKVLNNGS